MKIAKLSYRPTDYGSAKLPRMANVTWTPQNETHDQIVSVNPEIECSTAHPSREISLIRHRTGAPIAPETHFSQCGATCVTFCRSWHGTAPNTSTRTGNYGRKEEKNPVWNKMSRRKSPSMPLVLFSARNLDFSKFARLPPHDVIADGRKSYICKLGVKRFSWLRARFI